MWKRSGNRFRILSREEQNDEKRCIGHLIRIFRRWKRDSGKTPGGEVRLQPVRLCHHKEAQRRRSGRKGLFFKSEEDFRNLIDYNGFIEYARYVENFYGTPRKFVEEELDAGHNVILEIEVQGAFAIREQYEDALLVFITAPSAQEIKNRLIGRGTESEEVINKRLSRAVEESEDMCQYDYIIVNDDLEVCVDQVHAVVTAQACERRHNMELVKETMEGLKTL